MRVKIGKYKNGWIGPYQIADSLKIVGISESRCEAIGDWLSRTWVEHFCEWIYRHNPFLHRKIKIHIDPWDTWSMDETLAQIIAPMLRQLKKTKKGAPIVENSDVPEHLRTTESTSWETYGEIDEKYFDRWDWVLGEMIWAFEQLEGDANWEDQFHSGVSDIEWGKYDKPNPETGILEERYEMILGSKDTHVFDSEGYHNHALRMENGFRLFGKYYLSLWD
jgi:hypothetical protein